MGTVGEIVSGTVPPVVGRPGIVDWAGVDGVGGSGRAAVVTVATVGMVTIGLGGTTFRGGAGGDVCL